MSDGKDPGGKDPGGNDPGGNDPGGKDPGGQDPFELEPADDRPRHEPALPPSSADDVDDGPEPSGVDERTLAERTGTVRPRGASEPVPNPPGWPREVLGFPFRTPGPGFLLMAGGGLFLFDLMGTVEGLQLPGLGLKLFLLMFLLRAWLHVIATTAAGRDEPHGWTEALNFDWDELWRYARICALLVVVLLPGVVLWALDQTGLGVTLFLAGSLYASVIALGEALQDPALKYPWHALRWIVTRPLHCLLGGVGWWVLATTELVLTNLADESRFAQLAAALVLRAAGMVLLLISARIIGVMGRRWTVQF